MGNITISAIIRSDYSRVSNKRGNLARYIYKALSSPGFRAVILYRAGSWFQRHKMYRLAGLIERITHHSCYCEISSKAEIGAGLLIAHTFGLVIGGGTRLGQNCDLRQNITFGGNFSKRDAQGRSQPWVGDNVSVGAGAVIIGPVHIGSNAIIGANSVVNRDVPEGVIVSGVPARVIKHRWTTEAGRKL